MMSALSITPLYTAEASATGGRNGHVRSSDGLIDYDLAIPKSMGGPGGAKTNPEQLFAAGYASCFHSALGLVAGQAKVPLPKDATVTAHVHIGRSEPAFKLEVELKVSAPSMDKAALQKLVDAAHNVCPYSLATRNNIKVHLTVV
ncbi:hypothetical protein HK105_201399 [Polyrhizophydium stewartii]|uniref:Organic hydroperoxide resistance protein n=1 Tax=Polyrhizophydium stewartii TaxID=2732419 RepID=A0ABR4NI34_9FUNG